MRNLNELITQAILGGVIFEKQRKTKQIQIIFL